MCVSACFQGSRAVLLSSMNTGAVCERLRQLDGIDPGMLPQYSSTIKKVRLSMELKSQDFIFLSVCAFFTS